MSEDRELKMRCLELASKLLGNTQRDALEVIKVSNQLYASLPPGPSAPATKQAMARVVERNQRDALRNDLGASLPVAQGSART